MSCSPSSGLLVCVEVVCSDVSEARHLKKVQESVLDHHAHHALLLENISENTQKKLRTYERN